LVSEYSGGNKRKLCTAISLIGNPPMVFLDEPTTGMDPLAKRHVWNAIIKARQMGTSIVLTSHSMEECEALCTRLAIMVDGRLKCIGSSQRLKSKYGQGVTLLVKAKTVVQRHGLDDDRKVGNNRPDVLSNTTIDSLCTDCALGDDRQVMVMRDEDENWNLTEQRSRAITDYVAANIPGAILQDIHDGYFHYHIPNRLASLENLFQLMEQARTQIGIEDYSVGQTTLEQVFLNFTRSSEVQSNATGIKC